MGIKNNLIHLQKNWGTKDMCAYNLHSETS
jgi:hypothetical protein